MDMSSKQLIPNIAGVPIVGTSLSASANSDGIYMAYYSGISLVCTWTNTGVGTFTLQGSNDKERNNGQFDATIVNWATIASTSQASSGTTPISYNLYPTIYRWVRLVYTASSGTIVLTVNGQIKGF